MLIDLHSHVLHGVDDGPETFEMSLEMLRVACENGVRVLVATPHILDSFQNEELIVSRFRKLSRAIVDEKLPIDLFLGSEINFQFGIEDLLETSIGTFRGMARYFLVETTLTHYPKHFDEVMYSIIGTGKIPIFAHPERVGPIVGNSDLIANLVAAGVLIQINSGSLLGIFGERIKSFSLELLERGLVHFIASDAHNTRRRTFSMDDAWDEVCRRFDEDTAELLMYHNPLKVIMSESID